MQTFTFDLAGVRVTVEAPDSVPLPAVDVDVWLHLAPRIDEDEACAILGDLDVSALELPSPSGPTGLRDTVRCHREDASGADGRLYVSLPRDRRSSEPPPELRLVAELRERQGEEVA